MLIFSGEANLPLAEDICQYLRVPIGNADLRRFADGELYVKLNENVRGRDVFLIQSLSAPVNDHLMQTFLMMDALRRSSAARITVVIPYYGYARQDRKIEPRVPISARMVADLFEALHPDRLLCMDLHADQIQGFFQIPVDHLYATPVFVDYLKHKGFSDMVVTSPDTGGVERARFLARHLNAGLAIIDKRRPKPNVAEVMNVIGEVGGKVCVLHDDLIDTAGTISKAADALKKNGATQVLACATHAVLSSGAEKLLQDSCIDEIICTDTIPIPSHKRIKKLVVRSVAGIVGEAIRRIHNEESVSSLFI